MLRFSRQREPTSCTVACLFCHLAIVWYLLSTIFPHALVAAATLKRDKDALVEFMLVADTPGKTLAQNWTTNTDPCTDAWTGVTCEDDPSTMQSVVTELNLLKIGITGPLSPHLGNLSSLNYLDLSSNNLTEQIPEELGNLHNLTDLYLSNNELSGPIPKFLVNLPFLQRVFLDSNHLTGSITTSLPQSIVFLSLGRNSFTGPVPALENFPNLVVVSLPHNSLSGEIPVQLANLPALEELDLSYNNLTGSIPPEIGSSTQLRNLLLSGNALTGTIPEGIFTSLPLLATLRLSENNLSGPIPPGIGSSASSRLAIVSLAVNYLTGAIPLGLGGLGNLTELYLNDNKLNGTIPSNLGQLQKLRAIYLSNNNLTGQIPIELAIIPDLIVLSLSSNSLTGPIPEGLGNSVNRSSDLDALSADFSNNFFNGPLPTNSNWSLPLNCLNLTPGHYYQTGQRDSQACAQQYPELTCPCVPPKVVGTNGSCYCVTPLTIGVLFTCNTYESIGNFSANLGYVMGQLAKVADVASEQVAPLGFTTIRSPCSVRFSFNVLPLNGTAMGKDATARIMDVFAKSAGVVKVPKFQEGYNFISMENNSAPPPSPPQSRPSTGISTRVVIAIVSVLVAILAVVMAAFFLWFSFLRRPARMVIPGSAVRSWTFSELQTATGGFSDANILGHGGFATVYRGELEGRPVAVKRLTSGSSKRHQELAKEVETIGSIHHRNLVDLEGYCIEGNEYILIYTFMPNGSVEDWLFRRAKEDRLSWSRCVNIIKGTANALEYLHSGCDERIIHRDIKPANILLDEAFEAHVADFGFARSTVIADTHVSTRVVGTMGYLAPEYSYSGQLTEKSDVYSFGIVMLVILSHRKALSISMGRGTPLVDEVRLAVKENNLMGLIAPHFKDYDESEAMRLLHLAILCIQQTHQLRPSMHEVKQILCTSVDLPAAHLDNAVRELREATLHVEDYDSSFSQTGGSKEKSSGHKDKSGGDDGLQSVSYTFTQFLSAR